MELKEFFDKYPKVAVACSGGVDSAFLLYQAKRYAGQVRAYFVRSQFQPEFEGEDAKKLCAQAGAELTVIDVDVLSDAAVRSNPPDRCYYCKKRIFAAIRLRAEEDGYPVLLEGTNASDDVGDRPGVKALAEYGVLSPLRECGYDKERIRREAKEDGLFVHDKPAYACLATRIPRGRTITKELLTRVEQAENVLFSSGFTDFRVRLYHEAARLQLPEAQIPEFMRRKREITDRLLEYFDEVFLDCAVSR